MSTKTKDLLTKEEARIIEKTLQICKEIEDDFEVLKKNNLLESKLHQLSTLLFSFSQSSHLALKKLSVIPDHLHPLMQLRHFLNFVIPIERVYNKNLSEDEFLVSTDDKVKPAEIKNKFIFILHNLRSAFNVGAIFRLAETMGCLEIHIVGYTPNYDNTSVIKTSMKTSQLITSHYHQNLDSCLSEIKNKNYLIAALETAEPSINLFDSKLPENLAFLVGNERFGLESHELKKCDLILKIPMFGQKNSLNVVSALSMATFEWCRQNVKTDQI